MTKRIISIVVILLLSFSTLYVSADDTETGEYGGADEEIVEIGQDFDAEQGFEDDNEPNQEQEDQKPKDIQEYLDEGNIEKYIEEFNKLPLWERLSSQMMYPESMDTLLTTGHTTPVKSEEYEHLMTTELAPWLKVYHMTTEQQVYQNIKGGEWGQLIFTIAASPYDKNLVMLGNDTTGLYRSEDGGKTWRSSAEGLFAYDTITLLFDPDDENVVYVVTGGTANRARFGCIGVFKSEDKGNSWKMVLPLANTKRVGTMLAFGPKDENGNRPLYACSGDNLNWDSNGAGYTGIFRSWDRGETWENIGYKDRMFTNIYSSLEENLLIANISGVGLAVSYDCGDTWQIKSNGLPDVNEVTEDGKRPNDIVDTVIDPTNKNHWFTGTYSIRLFESFDKGESWTEVKMDLGLPKLYDGAYLRKLQFGRPKDGGIPRLFINMHATTESVRFSDDYGRTFKFPDYHQEKAYFLKPWHTGWFSEAIEFSPHDPDLVYIGRGSTFRISTNGGNDFYPSSSGYSGAFAYDFWFDKTGTLKYMAVVDTGIWRMAEGYEGDYIPVKDAGRCHDVSVANAKTVMGITMDPNDPMHGFATYGAGLYGRESVIIETFDGWETSTINKEVHDICMLRTEQGLGRKARINKFVTYHKQDSNVIYTNWFRSYDNGKTWHENEIEIRGICGPDNDILYGLKGFSVYVSYDRGNTWNYSGYDLPIAINHALVRATAGDYFTEGVFYVAEYSNMYKVNLKTGKMEIFGGDNGIRTRTGNPVEVLSLSQNPRDKDHFILIGRDNYACAWWHVFESLDGGKSWKDLEGLPMVAGVTVSKFHPTKNQVYIGSMMGTIVYDYGVKREMEKEQLPQ